MKFLSRILFQRPGESNWVELDPPLEMTASIPLNDVSSLRVTYSTLQESPLPLQTPEKGGYVRLQVARGTDDSWIDPYGCMFALMEDSRDISDQTGRVTFTLPGVASLLEGAASIEIDPLRADGSRQFTKPNPGMVLSTVLKEAQERGSIKHLTWRFDALYDSLGNKWPDDMLPTEFAWGASAQSILELFTSLGKCDWYMNGLELVLCAPGKLGTDFTKQANPPRVEIGEDITEAPSRRKLGNLAGRFLITGDEGVRAVVTNPNASSPYGIVEKPLPMGGIKDKDVAIRLAGADMMKARTTRSEYQRSIVLDGEYDRKLPLLDYQPGDWILAPLESRTLEATRVFEIRVSSDTSGQHIADLVLNDRFLDETVRREKVLKALANGANLTGGTKKAGTGTRRKLLVPAAPRNLQAWTDTYFNEQGTPRAMLIPSWDEVTEAVGVTDWVDGPDLETEGGARLTIIVAVYPGDELLRMAGYISVCKARGDTLVLVGCSRGEASSVRPSNMSKNEFAIARETEQAKGWRELAGDKAGYVQLGLPDGNLSAHKTEITAEVASWADKAAAVEIYVCSRADETSADRRAVAEAVVAANPKITRFAYPPNMVTGFKYQCKNPSMADKAMKSYAWSAKSSPSLWKLAKDQNWVTYLSAAPSGGSAQLIDGKPRLTVVVARPGEETRRLSGYVSCAGKRKDDLHLAAFNANDIQRGAWSKLTKGKGKISQHNSVDGLVTHLRELVASRVDVEVYVAAERGDPIAQAVRESGAKVIRYAKPWGTAQGTRYEVAAGWETACSSAWHTYYPSGKKNSQDKAIRDDAKSRRYVSWVTR